MPPKKRSALAVYNDLKTEASKDEKEGAHVNSGDLSPMETTISKGPGAKKRPYANTPLPKKKRRVAKVEGEQSTTPPSQKQSTTPPSQKQKPSKQARRKKRASLGKPEKDVATEDEQQSLVADEVEKEEEDQETKVASENSSEAVFSAAPTPRSKPSKAARKKPKVVTNGKKAKSKAENDEMLMTGNEQDKEEVDAEDPKDEGVQNEGLPTERGSAPKVAGLETPFYSQFNPETFTDSRVAASELFQMLIRPIPVEQFYSEVWEKRPLLIKRHKPDYNDGLFSSEELQRILVEHYLEYTVNLDITSYKNGERLTHNPAGRASPATVWESFKDGCSVRLLNPQTYSEPLWHLNSTLQEHFGSFVGANVYLTPANTQGFAPHYDDIEAFILQLEGKKQWKLYPPREGSEILPRYSSPNFSQDEIGTPIMDTVLEPGDLLYFPRGTIHQAMSLPDCHSLHVTLSTFQKNTWGDLLEKLVPAALNSAITEDLELRQGLPTDYLQYMGVVSSDVNDERRTWFCKKVTSMVSKLLQYLPLDAAVDKLATDHVNSCLPPCLTSGEKSSGVWSLGPRWQGGRITGGPKLKGNTRVKLLRHGVLRMVVEEEGPMIYHTLENSRIYQEKEAAGLAIREADAPAIEQLLTSYPDPVAVDDLAVEEGSTEDKIELCQLLFGQGLLLVVD